MENGQQSNGCCSWRSTGIVIGTLGIVESIGVGLFFLIIFGLYAGMIHLAVGIFVIFALNTAASILWLYGIYNKKSGYLLISLVWYVIPRLIMIFLSIILFFHHVELIAAQNDNKEQHENNYVFYHDTNLFNRMIIASAVYGAIVYVLSVICYIKIKAEVQRYTSEIPRLDVAYSAAPDFDIY